MFRLWIVLALVLWCGGGGRCEEVAGLHSGVWDVSTLIPGSGAIPASHELHVDAGEWTLRERHASRVSNLLDSLAAKLGVTYAAVPAEEAELCHAPPSLRWETTATRGDDGFSLDCGGGAWLTAAALRRFAHERFLHLRFETPVALAVRQDGVCAATQWGLQEAVVAAVSEETVVVTATLRNNTGGDTPSTCTAHFELTRRPSTASKAESSSTSAYAPVALLFVVMAARLLPRYILTRTGQIDKSSYRGQNPAKLSKERRLELLRKQRHIIEQMKAEDQANAPKEKTS